MKASIVCIKRSNDWMAHVIGDTTVWECAPDVATAIGRLAITLGLAVVQTERKPVAANTANRGDHVEGMPGFVYVNPQWPGGSEPCMERCADDDCTICNDATRG